MSSDNIENREFWENAQKIAASCEWPDIQYFEGGTMVHVTAKPWSVIMSAESFDNAMRDAAQRYLRKDPDDVVDLFPGAGKEVPRMGKVYDEAGPFLGGSTAAQLSEAFEATRKAWDLYPKINAPLIFGTDGTQSLDDNTIK